MTHKPTNLGPESVLWEEPFWQIVKTGPNGVFSSTYVSHLNSVLVHRCRKGIETRYLGMHAKAPRTYICNLYQLRIGCPYCLTLPPTTMQTLWTLHNADCLDNTRTQ